MKRLLIIGSGGSGKSTLAHQIHSITQLPIIHLNKHYWKPNWVEPSKKEWESIVSTLIKQNAWVMDGNYGGTFHLRMPTADTIIFLNRSRYICLWRALKRWWKYKEKDRGGNTYHFKGRYSNTQMALKGETFNQGKKVLFDMAYNWGKTQNTVRQIWKMSKDNGSNWATIFDGIYKKK